MRKKQNQVGFTLVEAVVYLAVSAVVLAFTTGMVLSGNNLFLHNRARSEAKQIGDAVYSHIAEELRYSAVFSVDGTTGSNTLNTSGGRLMKDGADVFGEAFYLGNTVELEAESGDGLYSVRLAIRVLDSAGNERYQTDSTVELINMKLKGVDVVVRFSAVTDPTLYYTRGATP